MLSIDLYVKDLCDPGFLSLSTVATLQCTCKSMSGILQTLKNTPEWRENASQNIQYFWKKYRPENMRKMLLRHVRDMLKYISFKPDLYTTLHIRLWKNTFITRPYRLRYKKNTVITYKLLMNRYNRIVHIHHCNDVYLHGMEDMH